MDKNDVRNLIDSVDHVYGTGHWTFRESQLDRLARIIAAQHEEEVAQRKAQVALMSEAFVWLSSWVETIGVGYYAPVSPAERQPAKDRISKALSAAPKVWRLKARTSLHYDLEVMAEGAPEEFRQLLIGRGMFAAWDVIVCPPAPEQPTESEEG